MGSLGDMVITGAHDRSLRRWERTDEPFFIEEEKEKRLESLFEADLEVGRRAGGWVDGWAERCVSMPGRGDDGGGSAVSGGLSGWGSEQREAWRHCQCALPA